MTNICYLTQFPRGKNSEAALLGDCVVHEVATKLFMKEALAWLLSKGLTLMLAVGKRPELFAIQTSPHECLNILRMWQLPSPA